ncbi:outer membrane beta-barrel protein [Herbaspirillum sp. WKF16]|uniref:outer membrane beta-barrel protein n=1 Tax=Herbaspirillum sp. WKF16 TaxID=3028312 RepID=UPI0023A96FE7|nr:outer membrane beta-barrel protein [Herbaspirillum sp. WKF16]WDZ95972.1 outer membrane beta-barrel protein [Herbaspirillum sp. WKF16]
MRTSPLILAAVLAASASAFAHAADAGSPWYMGASAGYAQNKVSNMVFPAKASTKDGGTGFKLYGGYQFSRHLAAELEYVHFGNYRMESPTINTTSKSSGLGLSAVGILPLSSDFSLLGKLGAMAKFTKARETYSFDNDVYTQNSTRIVPMLGVAAEYRFTPALALRAEYQYVGRSTVGENNSKLENSLMSAGLRYNF